MAMGLFHNIPVDPQLAVMVLNLPAVPAVTSIQSLLINLKKFSFKSSGLMVIKVFLNIEIGLFRKNSVFGILKNTVSIIVYS
jgi:hypothetical protein